jgi:small subunit ribosomal protein S21
LKDIEVRVIDNDIEKAMRILKKKIQNDGLFYEKPSEFRRRKQREALRRERIAAAKARHRR